MISAELFEALEEVARKVPAQASRHKCTLLIDRPMTTNALVVHDVHHQYVDGLVCHPHR
jgi:hypothetical protein